MYVRFEISARNAYCYARDIFSKVLRHDLRLSVSCISRNRRRNALYIWIHSIYDLLSIATAGVPLAVSKFVSKYNALGDYKTSRRMFRSGMVMMIVTGVLSFLVLYMTAPLFAEAMLGKQSIHNNRRSYDDHSSCKLRAYCCTSSEFNSWLFPRSPVDGTNYRFTNY